MDRRSRTPADLALSTRMRNGQVRAKDLPCGWKSAVARGHVRIKQDVRHFIDARVRPTVWATQHSGEAQRTLRRHRAEQTLEGDLHVLSPGQRGLELEPETWVASVRAHGLEPDGQQIVDWHHA